MLQETPTTMTAVQMYELAVKIAKEMSESSRCDHLHCDHQDMKRIVDFINKMWENPKDEWAFDFLTRRFNQEQVDVIERHCYHLMYNTSDNTTNTATKMTFADSRLTMRGCIDIEVKPGQTRFTEEQEQEIENQMREWMRNTYDDLELWGDFSANIEWMDGKPTLIVSGDNGIAELILTPNQ